MCCDLLRTMHRLRDCVASLVKFLIVPSPWAWAGAGAAQRPASPVAHGRVQVDARHGSFLRVEPSDPVPVLLTWLCLRLLL